MAQKEILHFEALDPDLLSNKPCKYPSGLENKLIEQLKAGNIPSAQSYAAQIFEYFLENVKSRDALKEYVCEFITVLKRTIAQMGIHPGVAPNAGALLELGALSSAEEIEVWYKSNVNSLIKQAEKGDDKNTDVINRVFEYSNKNFNKNITLELAASEVGLSPQYLSKIFKEKCGINFIDYITKKRMEYARELLEGDSKNIKEVSRLAGYEDSNYFCRIFKKETGLNPKQYRTKVRIRE
jgi:two-component system response regulator YesN